jgi:hypothetical protein
MHQQLLCGATTSEYLRNIIISVDRPAMCLKRVKKSPRMCGYMGTCRNNMIRFPLGKETVTFSKDRFCGPSSSKSMDTEDTNGHLTLSSDQVKNEESYPPVPHISSWCAQGRHKTVITVPEGSTSLIQTNHWSRFSLTFCHLGSSQAIILRPISMSSSKVFH